MSRSGVDRFWNHVGYVYWQTADWLIAEGLAEWQSGSGETYLRLTERGLELELESV